MKSAAIYKSVCTYNKISPICFSRQAAMEAHMAVQRPNNPRLKHVITDDSFKPTASTVKVSNSPNKNIIQSQLKNERPT